jgi:hypothetical protein
MCLYQCGGEVVARLDPAPRGEIVEVDLEALPGASASLTSESKDRRLERLVRAAACSRNQWESPPVPRAARRCPDR